MNHCMILVPVDFSESSAAALETAIELAEARQPATVWLFHVDPGLVPHYETELGVLEPTRLMHRLRMRSIEWKVGLDFPCIEEIVYGDPVEEILKKADELDADLIVMGTHGRTGLDRILVGSVTEQVLRKSPCPVLCVKPGRKDQPHAELEKAPKAVITNEPLPLS
ncbi:MAG: universal stress protein [Planctomycetota bacterium]